ncbi:DNA repair protein XRCC2-like [Schistocerca gregaria]|uniref:DNA repair protein XRCC2-like n=1 Tax=Schistocerca gregaria TaxID=7010 RepID=UPI00211ED47C|nr:DNA repair protein XRCC2-like [Schistocerca gregaria]
MAFQCDAESGVQFLSRCGANLSLKGIDTVIFETGPELNDVIEITGDPSCGKTLLVTKFLVKCVLPKEWGKFHIGGLNVGAILMDTDHHFHLLKLVNLMELHLMKCRTHSEDVEDNKTVLDSATVEKIIKESLRKLIILKCYDSAQYQITLYSLERLLSVNRYVSLLVLDSITAYYWQDVAQGGVRKMDLYVKKMLQTIKKCLMEYKLVLMYTKQTYFQSTKSSTDSHDDKTTPTYRIHLQQCQGQLNNNLFYAQISGQGKTKCILYKIDNSGITWNP